MQVPYPNEMVQFKYIGERIRKLCVYILQLKWFRQKEIPSYSWCVWLFVLLDLQIDTWIHLHLRGQCVLLSLMIKTLILKHKTPHRHAQSNVWPNVWEFDSSVKISSEKYTFFFFYSAVPASWSCVTLSVPDICVCWSEGCCKVTHVRKMLMSHVFS